jgi:GH24 family phage-related lysozyme (muramidase)
MTRRTVYYIAGGVAALLLMVSMNIKKWKALAASVIASFEGFSPVPYWDVSRWSWGYGTPAPGPDGTITKAEAMADLQTHAQDDYDNLAPRITRTLTANQWAAYLSFSYNLGVGNAYNLVDDINSGDDTALEIHWKKYIYAGGVVNSDLVARRAKEWSLWSQNIL